MKKKLIPSVMALAGVMVCTIGLSACGNDQEPYYNKTYTLPGTCTIDWDGKVWTDVYAGEDKWVSLKTIVSRHWDEIDWNETAKRNDPLEATAPPHETLQAFMDSFKEFEQKAFKDVAGLSVSLSGKDDLKLTVSMPEAIMQDGALKGYDAEITMPFAETEEQYNAITLHENVRGYFRAGYTGRGFYKMDDTHFLTVFVDVNPWRRLFDIEISVCEIHEEGGLSIYDVLSTNRNSVYCLYDAKGEEIKTIEYHIDFEDAKTK